MRTLVLVTVLAMAGVASADKTPAGLYVVDDQLSSPDLSTRKDKLPRCDELANGIKYDADKFKVTIKYVKTAQRAVIGRQIMDFLADDGTSVSVVHEADFANKWSMWTQFDFGLGHDDDSTAWVHVVMSIADEQKRFICHSVYWFRAHHE